VKSRPAAARNKLNIIMEISIAAEPRLRDRRIYAAINFKGVPIESIKSTILALGIPNNANRVVKSIGQETKISNATETRSAES
jgi:hypothetical protein